MNIKKVRQILKSFADDTRLRILSLLDHGDLTVSQMCRILRKNQSNLSKHLMRLRLTGLVGDRRESLNVYYHLTNPKDPSLKKLLRSVIDSLSGLEIFKQDVCRLKTLKTKG